MSAIRPPATSPLFPAQSPPPAGSPARASRSDFFRAALDGVGAPAGPEPARHGSAPTPVLTPDDRPQRPGSLLDIRV